MAQQMKIEIDNLTIQSESNSVSDDELKAYKELVAQKADEASSDILPNAGKEHAAIVMSKMFEKTVENVNMVVGNFDGSISDDPNYMSNLEKCVNNGININVIFLDTPNINSRAYNFLLQKRKERTGIYLGKASKEFKTLLNKSGVEKHFSVFDKNKYRFEKDTKDFLAWFSFNDETNASKLLSVFDNGLKTATPL